MNQNRYSYLFISSFVFLFFLRGQSQSPGGVSAGLRAWYKADAISGYSNGQDLPLWPDSYTADGAAQDAVQGGKNLILSIFGNRQPQYRTSVSYYNFHPFVDFTKQFSSLFAYQAHSNKGDYKFEYFQGASLYQVGAVINKKGSYVGTGLGGTTAPIGGYRYEYGLPWKGSNRQYYGTAYGYYEGTVSDYGYYKFPFPPYSYNFKRTERKTYNNVPYIGAVLFDKYGTYNTCCVVGTDANTAIQTRTNGDKWSWGYSYTPAGPSLFIGNEYTNYNAGRWWKGGIPEVILYNRKLNTQQGGEADRVDTYLGIKYGVTLYHNYYLSDGTLVWDTACNRTYNKDIAGLARDNGSLLNQKQTRSVNNKSIITMSIGDVVEFNNDDNSALISNTFSLVFGSNGMSTTLKDGRVLPGGFANLQANTMPNTVAPAPCLTEQNMILSKRKWLVQEQAGRDLGIVKVYVESKDLQSIDWSCSNSSYIIVGTDPLFSNPKFYPLTLATGTSSSTTDYVAEINFSEGAPNASTTVGNLKLQYFAVAGIGAQCNCGGVPGYTVWVRAENGKVYADTATATLTNAEYGQPVRRVYNMSGLGDGFWKYNNIDGGLAAYNTNTYQALFGVPSATSNFNPTIDFGNTIYPGFRFTNILTRTTTNASYNFADTATAFASTYHPVTTASLSAINTQVWGAGYRGNVPGFIVYSGSEGAGWGPGTIKEGNASTCSTAGSRLMAANYTMLPGRNYQSTWTMAFDGTYCSVLYPKFRDSIGMNGTRLAVGYNIRYIGDNPKAQSNHNDLVLRGARDLSPDLQDWPTSFNGAYKNYSLHDAIYYERLLTEEEKDRVETYLGIRNGETISNEKYLASDGTILWDSTNYTDLFPDTIGYARYNYSITGIGRDDASCLVQKISRNTADTVVTVSLGTIPTSNDQTDIDEEFLNNKEFIVWGSNGANMNIRITTDLPSVLPGCIDSRLAREYRIRLTGANTGNYKTQVRWQLDNNILDAVNATSISLLIDEDGDGNYNTGAIRVINAASYDVTTNTIVFNDVTWSVTGDTNPNDAVMTIGWGQTTIGKVALWNNTANGGGNCTCSGAVAVAPLLCSDAEGWRYHQNASINNRKVFAINLGANTGVSYTVTMDASSTQIARRKTTLNAMSGGLSIDSAATIGARMVNVTINSGTITSPVKVRFYYDQNEIKTDSAWIVGVSGVGNGGGVSKQTIQDSTWSWFKFDGTVSDVLNALTASGLPIATDITASNGKMLQLIPDEEGVEDGVRYVQFNYITSFSTFGYIQTYVKSNAMTVLPVGLKSFTFEKRNQCEAALNWVTSSEYNTRNFEVEASVDNGLTWKKTSVVNAAGNSPVDLQYQLNVSLERKVTNLFRLKIVDEDGSYVYSPVVALRCEGETVAAAISPNPATTEAIITGFTPGSIITIVSADGKIMQRVKTATNAHRINIRRWATGVYFVDISDQKEQKPVRLKLVVNR